MSYAIQISQCACNSRASNRWFSLDPKNSGELIQTRRAWHPVACERCDRKWRVDYNGEVKPVKQGATVVISESRYL